VMLIKLITLDSIIYEYIIVDMIDSVEVECSLFTNPIISIFFFFIRSADSPGFTSAQYACLVLQSDCREGKQ
jgi:hypothetical protein